MPEPVRQADNARDFKNKLFISKPFQSKVQSHLGVDASIAGAGTATSRTAEAAERASHSQRLTKTRRRKITNWRRKIHVVQEILEVDRDVQVVSLFARRSNAAGTLWSWSSACRPRATSSSSHCRRAARSTSRSCCCRIAAAVDVSECKRAADAEV